jgi:hypothetical protein
MVESITAVVGIVGVVSVLSGSFLGSIPSMDVTCVSLSAQREISQILVRRPDRLCARRIRNAQSMCSLVGPGHPNTEAVKHLPSLHAVMIQSS